MGRRNRGKFTINSRPSTHRDVSPFHLLATMSFHPRYIPFVVTYSRSIFSLAYTDMVSPRPQGAYHNVVRWVHRSSFVIRAPPKTASRAHNQTNPRFRPQSPRIPIPDTSGLFVDPGWYGTVVVETEGTNECLADLQDRCGPGTFPPRAAGANAMRPRAKESKKVFRILRERR